MTLVILFIIMCIGIVMVEATSDIISVFGSFISGFSAMWIILHVISMIF